MISFAAQIVCDESRPGVILGSSEHFHSAGLFGCKQGRPGVIPGSQCHLISGTLSMFPGPLCLELPYPQSH